jgi:excisionase family DNA binding protein
MPGEASPAVFRDLLRDRGLTFEAAAVLGQVDTSTISRIANGQIRARPQTIVALARALGISAKRLEAMTAADIFTATAVRDAEAAVAAGRLLYRVGEAAEILSISRSKAWELIARGELPSVKIDGARRVTRTALETYVAGLGGGDAPAA